jgi:hypothetical protein
VQINNHLDVFNGKELTTEMKGLELKGQVLKTKFQQKEKNENIHVTHTLWRRGRCPLLTWGAVPPSNSTVHQMPGESCKDNHQENSQNDHGGGQ